MKKPPADDATEQFPHATSRNVQPPPVFVGMQLVPEFLCLLLTYRVTILPVVQGEQACVPLTQNPHIVTLNHSSSLFSPNDLRFPSGFSFLFFA